MSKWVKMSKWVNEMSKWVKQIWKLIEQMGKQNEQMGKTNMLKCVKMRLLKKTWSTNYETSTSVW